MTTKGPRLVRSHAAEADVPGTVDLRVKEGDDTAYNQAFFPVPAEDPNDPLQWSQWKKIAILVICSLYSFLSLTALAGPSVYLTIWAEEFNVSLTRASGLVTYPTICSGVGTLITIPMYLKFGRRPVMLGSITVYLAGLIASSRCTTYQGLMATRVISALAMSVCEGLPVQLVNDVFFLHERGNKLGIYTLCLCWGSTGSLYAGYMLAAGYGWRLFFYVEIAFAGLLLVAAFLVVEETRYHRDEHERPLSETAPAVHDKQGSVETAKTLVYVPPRRSVIATLKPWSSIDHSESFFLTAFRSFSYFCVPSVLWATTTYGIHIGVGFVVNYTFPIKITAPPYDWSKENSGLFALGNLIGYGLGIPYLWSSDWLAAKLTRRNGGIREAEMRLGALLPGLVFAPAGLIIYGLTAQRSLHWIGYFFGVGMVRWTSLSWFTFTLAYAMDSYNANLSESLIAISVGKQMIGFGFGVKVLNWVKESGYAVIISGVFCGVLLANSLFVVVFMVFGKRIRIFFASTWLAKMHRRTIRQVVTH